jgi:flagellar protein FlbD
VENFAARERTILRAVRDAMIRLTRLGGEPFILNADLIQYVETRPDTFVTLVNGERVVVGESADEVLRRAVEYQQTKHLIPSPQPR